MRRTLGTGWWLGIGLASILGCATTGPPPAAKPDATATLQYGGADGSSCEKAVVINEKAEMAGIAAEYRWLALRYPGYKKRMQSLKKCGDRPADVLAITTADGRDLEVTFDISQYFGKF